MFGLENLLSVASFLRDGAYDTVFHVGDTGLQFTADVIRGPSDTRYGKYAYRQIESQQRKVSKQQPKMQTREKPLKYNEKQAFTQIMKRQHGESVIEHWKRQKYLLSYPNKQKLVKESQQLNSKMKASQKAHDTEKLAEQFRAITKEKNSQSQKQSKGQKQ